MAALGIGMVWVAYGMGLYGVFLITGKNVSLKQCFSLSTWPPKTVGNTCGKAA